MKKLTQLTIEVVESAEQTATDPTLSEKQRQALLLFAKRMKQIEIPS